MGRENVHSKGDAESGSNIIIPLDGKVFVLSTKDWNKAIGLQLLNYFAIALFYIEINQEQDTGDIHKLHDGDFLELAQCLVILSMMFLQKRNVFKYDANENVYCRNQERNAIHQSRLIEIVLKPHSARGERMWRIELVLETVNQISWIELLKLDVAVTMFQSF